MASKKAQTDQRTARLRAVKTVPSSVHLELKALMMEWKMVSKKAHPKIVRKAEKTA